MTSGTLARCISLAVALLLAAALPSPGIAEDTAPVELPAFFVETGLRTEWLYARRPGVELLTTCPRSVAREFMAVHEQQEQLLRTIIPPRYLDRSNVPTIILLIDAETSRRMTDHTLRELMRSHQPATRNRWEQAKVMPNPRLDDRDLSVVLTERQSRFAAMDFSFAPSRVALLLDRMVPALPPWVVTGVLGLYRDCQIGTRQVQVGPATWISASETTRLQQENEWPREVPPLPVLLAHLPAVDDAAGLQTWRAQAALFVRWALVADDGKRAEAFWTFVDRCREAVPTEATFIQCFGMSSADLRDQLSDYLPVAVAERKDLPPVTFRATAPIAMREPTPAELGRIRGEWERLATQYVAKDLPEVRELYLAQARKTLQRARERAPGDPGLLATAGLLEHGAGNSTVARDLLEKAFTAGTRRPHPLVTLAALRLEAARSGLAENTRLTATDTGYVLAPLMEAARLAPALPEAYRLLGDVWLSTSLDPTDADLNLLAGGARRFPASPAVVARVALVHLQAGRQAEALDWVERSLSRVAETERRRPFELLREHLITSSQTPATGFP